MNNENMQFEKYFESLFNKFWYNKMMNSNSESYILEQQKRLHQAIVDYRYQLTKEEKAMLIKVVVSIC